MVCHCDFPNRVICFDEEKELLEAWAEFQRVENIDWLIGYNIYDFDLRYLCKRGDSLQAVDIHNISKLKGHMCELVEKRLSSSALGNNTMYIYSQPGRFVLDIYQQIKRDYSLESYKLDSVAEHFLGKHKLDVSPIQIFEFYETGDPAERRKVAEYCLMDTLLPLELVDHLFIKPGLIEMAKATWVPIYYLVERGQQIKCFSQIVKKSQEMGFIVPSVVTDRLGKYQGATVLEPNKGAYFEPITALDFASLYPSIQMAHNMCYTTLTTDPKVVKDNPDVTFESFNITLENGNIMECFFAQNTTSVLPEILQELKLSPRKRTDKALAAPERRVVPSSRIR